MALTDPANPSQKRVAPPRKKPTPLRAFLEPVRMATQRKRVYSPCCSWPASTGTTVVMALLALILLRSLAMPLRAWAAIT